MSGFTILCKSKTVEDYELHVMSDARALNYKNCLYWIISLPSQNIHGEHFSLSYNASVTGNIFCFSSLEVLSHKKCRKRHSIVNCLHILRKYAKIKALSRLFSGRKLNRCHFNCCKCLSQNLFAYVKLSFQKNGAF